MALSVTILFILVVLCASSRSQDEIVRPEVTAPAGTFRGVIQTSLQSYNYAAFLSIPYAQPPIGELRFAKPQPYPKIEDVFDASTASPSCVQSLGENVNGGGSEDCLYLNVYVPLVENEGIGEGSTLKKVFVFIHGGGLFSGSSNQYVPGDIVATGGIIVVTFNYRLSWLGFLKGDTPELPGNQGIWDQLMALNWVVNNIRSFGGDPDDVTVGGHDMGATSASILSIAPQAKGLFTKGILASSSMFKDSSTKDSSNDLVDILTVTLGCKEADFEATLRCLRNQPAESFSLSPEPSIRRMFISVDGDLISRPLKDLIQDKNYLSSVGFYSRDYLVTLNNNEGSVFFHGILPVGVGPDDLDPEFLSQWTDMSVPESEKLLAWYNQPLKANFNPVFDIIADFEIYMPTFEFLETFASKKADEDDPTKTGKSYLLLFDHLVLYMPSPFLGTIYGIDLNYLFDFKPSDALKIFYNLEADGKFTANDWMMKRRYIGVVADFVKTGNPGTTLNQDFDFIWPPYDLKSEGYLRFDLFASLLTLPLENRRMSWKNPTSLQIEKTIRFNLKDEL